MKIRDRFWLSLIAGIGGSLVKSLIVRGAKQINLAEFDGAETAAGMLIPAHKIYTTQGQVIGQISNLIVGIVFGMPTIYLLSLTGKDKAILKGTATGMLAWTILYGALANLGFSTTRPAMPHTVLSNLAGHAACGATVSLVATRLGDPGLFDGTIPLFVKREDKQLAYNCECCYQTNNSMARYHSSE